MRPEHAASLLWNVRSLGARLGAAALALGLHAAGAGAQLVPQRLYYGVGQAAPIEVRAPDGQGVGEGG
ncbi:MAG: hypothetical protein C0475_08605, partial [Planctomyces sp.]|nr:hypothetical protein [Planctomyces sp.]